MIETNCEQCQTPMMRYPSQMRKKFGAFCSRECLGKFRSAKLVGDYAANYKYGFRLDRKYQRALAPWHPAKDRSGTVALHRLIAEARLGRFLSSKEIVHHIDGNAENNHWENLGVMTQSDHAREHLVDGTIMRNPKNGRLERRRA